MKKVAKIILFIIIVMSTLLALYFFNTKEHTLYVAIVGPMSGSAQKNGAAMIEGAMLYQKICKSEKYKHLNIQLVIFDDQNDPEKARQIAHQIAQDDRILLVIGHYGSMTSQAAGLLYQKFEIPAITASATDENVIHQNNWYFRIIPGNDIQSIFVANFIKNELKLEQVEFLIVNDQHQLNIKKAFIHACNKLNLTIRTRVLNAATFDTQLENIVLDFQSNDHPIALFIVANAIQASEIVGTLKYPGSNITIVGCPDLATDTFIAHLNNISFQENATPGYHSDHIFAATPFLIEMGNEASQFFQDAYITEYGKTPSWVSYAYYDAIKTAVTAIARSDIFNTNDIHHQRKMIKDNLSGMKTKQRAINGITGDIVFNDKGSVETPYYFGVYQNQKLSSAFSQFQIIPQNTDVNQVLDQVLAGRLIKVKKRYMRKTEIVYTGIDMNEIKELNLTQRTFSANFYIWFRYKKHFAHAVDIEFENSLENLAISSNVNHPLITRVLYREKKDYSIQAFRVNATFKGNFNFRAFPFDTHKLVINFRHNKLSRDKVIYVPDLYGMDQYHEFKKELTQRSHALEGWTINNVIYYQDLFINESSLGDPDAFNSKNQIVYSRFNAEIMIKRKIVNYLIKNLFLIIVLIVISYITYFIPPDQFSIRISIGMSTLLTSAFSHIKMTTSIPVAYLLALEYSFFGVYAIATLSIIISVLIYKNYKLLELAKSDQETIRTNKLIKRLTMIGLLFHPIIVLFSSILIPSIYILNPTDSRKVNSVSITCLALMTLFCFFFTRIKEVKQRVVQKDDSFFDS